MAYDSSFVNVMQKYYDKIIIHLSSIHNKVFIVKIFLYCIIYEVTVT